MGGVMVVKIDTYNSIKGIGYYKTIKDEKVKFRYDKFYNKALWAGEIGIIDDEGKIKHGKWYHKLVWYFGRALWQLRQMI